LYLLTIPKIGNRPDCGRLECGYSFNRQTDTASGINHQLMSSSRVQRMKLLQQQGQQALAAESAETPSTQVQVSVPAAPSSIVSSTADLSKMSRAERMKFMTQQLESDLAKEQASNAPDAEELSHHVEVHQQSSNIHQ